MRYRYLRKSLTPPSMKPFILVPILLCALLTACSTVQVRHEFNPEIDIARYESFGLLPIPHPQHDEVAWSVLGDAEFALLVASSILESKGFRKQENKDADFYVGVRVAMNRGLAAARSSSLESAELLAMKGWDGAQLTRGMGDPIDVYEPPKDGFYDPPGVLVKREEYELYLIVDVFDARTRQLCWQGWAKGVSFAKFDGDLKRAKAIEAILKTFPN